MEDQERRQDGENKTLLPVDEFVWRTWREDEISKKETLQLADKLVRTTQNAGLKSRSKIPKPIKRHIEILLQE